MFKLVRWAIWKVAKFAALVAATVVVTLFVARAYTALQGPALRPWHTFVPMEMDVDTLRTANWANYLQAEDEIFRSVQREVVAKLEPEDRPPANRYFDGSPLYSARFGHDWNRSFVLVPQGKPVGAAVFLHGLTDSPYSLRHIAERYSARGFVAVAIRLPGHGTVPGALTDATWEDWQAATQLAVREAVSRAGAGKPLHIIGYSNGGALALKYTLDALDDPAFDMPDRVILMSPMVGVTGYARFAELAALPAYFPAFVKASWLDILPEFNPFKYNSFPVNAAHQSYRLTTAVQTEIEAALEEGKLGSLPPIITFQSAVDHTVSARALVKAFYDKLPANGSELVLFDINRAENLELLMASSAETALSSLLGPSPRTYRVTVISNAGRSDGAVAERVTEPGSTAEMVRSLGLYFPPGVFSLSHIALPFPPNDPLYGNVKSVGSKPEFGINLGAAALRGETGVLVVTLDTVMRLSYDPFFSYLMERIDATLATASIKADKSRP
jgi:alpha-beta hydrolase superfamily lysophospholipase